jgi:hypothetical protein
LQQDFVLTIGLIILQAAKRPVSSSAGTTAQKGALDLPSFEDDDDDDDCSVLLDSQTDNSTMDEATPPKKVSVTQKSIEFMIKLNCFLNRQGLVLIMRGGRLVEEGGNARRRAGRGQNQSPPEVPGVEGGRVFE